MLIVTGRRTACYEEGRNDPGPALAILTGSRASSKAGRGKLTGRHVFGTIPPGTAAAAQDPPATPWGQLSLKADN